MLCPLCRKTPTPLPGDPVQWRFCPECEPKINPEQWARIGESDRRVWDAVRSDASSHERWLERIYYAMAIGEIGRMTGRTIAPRDRTGKPESRQMRIPNV